MRQAYTGLTLSEFRSQNLECFVDMRRLEPARCEKCPLNSEFYILNSDLIHRLCSSFANSWYWFTATKSTPALMAARQRVRAASIDPKL